MRRHRRRPASGSFVAEERPRWIIRLVIGAVVLFLLWFLGGKLVALLTGSSAEQTAARLSISGQANVEVSLQGNDPQRAENDLKIYEGDSLITHGGGQAALSFFDGTRIRMDENTELLLYESTREQTDSSVLTLEVAQGKLWIATPSQEIFSGAITRTVVFNNFSAEIPSDTSALLSNGEILVAESSGLGIDITLTLPDAPKKQITIGEGQMLTLDENARMQIAAGKDPYDFRDAITREATDPFVLTSIAAFAAIDGVVLPSDDSSSSASDDSTEHLTVNSPLDETIVAGSTVIVSGRVGPRVQTVKVNGYDIPVKVDRTFSQEIALPSDTSVTLAIQAQNAEGLTLSEISRTVKRNKPALGVPVISKPVASGATFTTSDAEVKISGTVPANTTGVMVNDYRLQLFKPGDRSWQYIASIALGNMRQGENIYSVRLVDEDGNRSGAVSIKIISESAGSVGTGSTTVSSASSLPIVNNTPLTPGILSVTAPSSGGSFETSEVEILIEGKTSVSTYAVYVNDYQLKLFTPGKNFWNYIASVEYGTLKKGQNLYHIVARNDKGEILDAIDYTITLKE